MVFGFTFCIELGKNLGDDMAIYKLIDNDNPLLKEQLTLSDDVDREKLKTDLIDTMKNFEGIGLSANQIGIMERAFVMYLNFSKREIMCCFNPKIVFTSEEEDYMDEGCLSWPGLWLKVKRPIWIEVEYENENGEHIKDKLKGLEARVFQHEYDHMEGTDFTQKVSRLRLDMAKKKKSKNFKKSKIIQERMSL